MDSIKNQGGPKSEYSSGKKLKRLLVIWVFLRTFLLNSEYKYYCLEHLYPPAAVLGTPSCNTRRT